MYEAAKAVMAFAAFFMAACAGIAQFCKNLVVLVALIFNLLVYRWLCFFVLLSSCSLLLTSRSFAAHFVLAFAQFAGL